MLAETSNNREQSTDSEKITERLRRRNPVGTTSIPYTPPPQAPPPPPANPSASPPRPPRSPLRPIFPPNFPPSYAAVIAHHASTSGQIDRDILRERSYWKRKDLKWIG
ncbi:hypothetical protein I203_105213 [Kwoniella mangroviensis CBS 8507]|uniref:uncharacterized protein n=1 Tax=Kwoniella mangroviensis CBS 8507 TaxID=1296122 RepID=UPI00080D54BE|nr:uncharacterized protein I203_01032 [Kwoniella mangroviensis CBS 8507]OCF69178.1 hypothetical protein I203_01032 [Kwoniella mangroviensis CBS 8507]